MAFAREKQREKLISAIADLERDIEQNYLATDSKFYWYKRFEFVENMQKTGWGRKSEEAHGTTDDFKLLQKYLFASSFHSAQFAYHDPGRRYLSKEAEACYEIASTLTGIPKGEVLAIHEQFETRWLKQMSSQNDLRSMVDLFKSLLLWLLIGLLLAIFLRYASMLTR